MNIQGQHRLSVPPEVVWETLHDEATLRDTIPGCQELAQTADNVFTGSATVGIGAIKGLYRGNVTLLEEKPHSSAKIRIETKSGHAEIRGSGSVQLEPSDGGTLVRYEGDAQITGILASVGQRLLPSASKSLIESFFKNVEEVLKQHESQRS